MSFLSARRQPVFTVGQLQRLSNIFDNAGQVVFGVVVLSPLVSEFDKINPWMVLLGGIGTLGSWLMSIFLARKAENL